MPRLVYLDNTGHEQQIHISESNPEVSIGRHPSCMIHTPNATVSRFHCAVKLTREGCEVVDQDSSSGTFLNSYKISRQLLRHGDEVCCGRFPLMFYEDHIQDIPWPDALWGGPTGWLLFKDDGGNERSLRMGAGSPRITIGRQNDCTIQTSDHSVSRVHAEIVFENGQFEVVDLNSANGTRVNTSPQRLSRQVLRTGDEVRLGQGRFAMHFYEDPGVPLVSDQGRAVSHTVAPQFPSNPGQSGPVGRPPGYFATAIGADVPQTKTMIGDEAMAAISPQALSAPEPAQDSRVQELEDENTRLRREVDELNARYDTMRRRVEDRSDSELQRELNQKQIVIDNLKHQRDEHESSAKRLGDELEEARTDLRRVRDESEQMRYKLMSLEREQGDDDTEISTLRNDNASLKSELESFRRKFKEASDKAHLLEFELNELKGDEAMTVDEGGGGSNRGPSGVFSMGDTRVLQATENLNDVVSEFRNDLRNMRDYIDMIKQVYDAFNTIELQYVTSTERNRVEEALKENAPDMAFEDINMALEQCLNNVSAMKDRLLELRETVG